MKIRPYTAKDQAQLVALWRACELTRPQNDPIRDIARKLEVQPAWLLVGELDGQVMASLMLGYDGHRGWINYLAVAPEHRRSGHARALMTHGETLLSAAGCPKINLQVRSTNAQTIAFYQGLGYASDEVISLGKRLIHDPCH